MDRIPRGRTMVRLAVGIIVLAAITAAASSMTPAHAASPSYQPPIIITKIDPWSPLRGLDGEKWCFKDESGSQISGVAFAWIELYNTTNETLATAGDFKFEVRAAVNSSGIGGSGLSMGGYPYSITLDPKQSCLVPTADTFTTRIGVGGSGGNGPPPGADKDGAIVSIDYTIKNGSSYRGRTYSVSTPALSDPYGDLAYWQLDTGSDKWVFQDDMAGKRNLDRVTITSMTAGINHAPIIVNLTLPEEIRAPAVAQFDLTFINSTTMQPINDGTTVVYEIEYRGPPALYGIHRNVGYTSAGSDVKFAVMNQTGSLDVAIKITALNFAHPLW
ncbi:MAG: hypothetical protein AB1351_00680 [Thermoproteota archaeon]